MRMGWCPSDRLFQAAAGATAVLSHEWARVTGSRSPGQYSDFQRSSVERAVLVQPVV